ncbi:hypothetical protein GTA08_BOTSDO04000 [Neofusicoccum parvum]|nr:hypothetical protein GTA08_BOTSDO04000 [Neofusicoccum parvum]
MLPLLLHSLRSKSSAAGERLPQFCLAPNASPAASPNPFPFRAGPPPAPLNFSRHTNTTAAAASLATRRNDACLKRKRTCEEHPGPIRKKRRLRLTLITSRLSLPFAVPTTHIVDRGRSRIAVWAKQKALGRSLLRKAAILNRVTRRVEAAIAKSPNMAAGRRGEIELLRRKGIEMTRLAKLRGSLATVNSTRPVELPMEGVGVESSRAATQTATVDVPTRSCPNFRAVGGVNVDGRKDYAPSPPSPLGQSNYDALDLEGDGEEKSKEHPEPSGHQEEEQVEDDAYFDSLIFGVAAASPSTNDSVFVSEYDRLDDLDDDYASSIFSSACASPSATTATALTAEDQASPEAGGSSPSMFDHLTEISSEDAIGAPAVLPPRTTTPPPPPKPKRPKGWNPNFASAPLPEERDQGQHQQEETPPPSDDRVAEMLQEKERQRQVLFLDLPNHC